MVSDVNELTPKIEDYDLPVGGFAKFSGLDYSVQTNHSHQHIGVPLSVYSHQC